MSVRSSGIIFLLLLLCSLLPFGQTAWAQGDGGALGGWTEPLLLFEDRNGFSRVDYMIADPAGSAHIFWSHNPQSPYAKDGNYDEANTAIFYQHLRDGGWDSPQDILLRSQAQLPFGAVIDRDGFLHIASVFGGPPCVGYMRIHIQDLADPHDWPQPECLAATGVGVPDLAINSAGDIYIVYVGRDQQAVAILKSIDGGDSWSSLITVADNNNSEVLFGYPRITVDSEDRLHIVWGELAAPDGYPWQAILYTHSMDSDTTWSSSSTIADAHQGEPNLAVDGDKVHVVWNGDAGYQGRYYRLSKDGGQSWSDRTTLPLPITSGGLQGAPAIVVDTTGVVHILYTDSPRLYYITQQDGLWSWPIQITGPESTGAQREINYPMLAITEGNQLHALYTRDAQAVYYQQYTIDAPHQPSSMFSGPVTPTLTEVVGVGPEHVAPTPVPAGLIVEPETTRSLPGSFTLVLSLLPALLLVIGVLIASTSRVRR